MLRFAGIVVVVLMGCGAGGEAPADKPQPGPEELDTKARHQPKGEGWQVADDGLLEDKRAPKQQTVETPLVVLPGPCVVPATWMARQEEAEYGLRRADEVDFDGDGRADMALGVESRCGVHTGNCQWYLFVMRGRCGHFVGTAEGYIEVAATRSAGLFDLESDWNMGCAGLDRVQTRYRFDGSEYKAAESRECHCPTDFPAEAEDDESTCDPFH